MQLNFEWDPIKARANERKHGVTFPRASQVFRDPLAISAYDEEHGAQEERWATLGVDSNGIPLVVIHTWHEIDADNVAVRIISARRATRRETVQYQKRGSK